MKEPRTKPASADRQPASNDGLWMREAMAGLVSMAGDKVALESCITHLQSQVRFIERLLAMCEQAVGSSPVVGAPRPSRRQIGADGRTRVGLSDRENEVVGLMVAGKAPTEIAAKLDISVHTVRNHLKASFRKLGVHIQIELINKAVADGVAKV